MIATLARDPVEQSTLEQHKLMVDLRLAQFLVDLNGCSPQRAIALIRKDPTASPLERLAYAMAAARRESSARIDEDHAVRML